MHTGRLHAKFQSLIINIDRYLQFSPKGRDTRSKLMSEPTKIKSSAFVQRVKAELIIGLGSIRE